MGLRQDNWIALLKKIVDLRSSVKQWVPVAKLENLTRSQRNVLDTLAREGFIERKKNGSLFIRLTDKGEQLAFSTEPLKFTRIASRQIHTINRDLDGVNVLFIGGPLDGEWITVKGKDWTHSDDGKIYHYFVYKIKAGDKYVWIAALHRNVYQAMMKILSAYCRGS